jgi:hypothetical protein
VHEAGHAVIARALGVPAGRASIVRRGDTFGSYEFAGPEETLRAWRAHGRHRPAHYARDA